MNKNSWLKILILSIFPNFFGFVCAEESLKNSDYDLIIGQWKKAHYMELKAEKELNSMLERYEKKALEISIDPKDPIDLSYKKTQALLILAFASWRSQKNHQAEQIFEHAFQILPPQNPKEGAFDVANLLDEAARFYDSQGNIDRAATLHFKAGDLRNGAYSDFYIGLVLKSAGKYDEACEWFRLGLKRREDASRRGLLSKAASSLHTLVIYGNIGETMWLKARMQDDQAAKQQAKAAFEAGDKLAATYLEWLETENKFLSLDRGFINFYRRYLTFLFLTDDERYAPQRSKVNSILQRAGLTEKDIKISDDPPAKYPLTVEIPDLKDYLIEGFSETGNYVILKQKIIRN